MMSSNSTTKSTATTTTKTAVARLRELLADHERIIVCPGVYDGLTARLALREGFECLYMTGAGTAASRLGMPDFGLVTLPEMLANASMIASLDRRTPLIADADTGYGGPLMVARTVHSYMQAGVAALHLEDQVVTKRCGHLVNKELVGQDVWWSRIKAAVMARQEMQETVGGDIVIIARTDALQGYGYDEAIKRLKGAIALGADVAFLEGFTSIDDGRRACEELAPTPVLYNMVHGGVTPDIGVHEAQQVGFRIVIYPCLALTEVYKGVGRVAQELRETGRISSQEGANHGGIRDVFGVCGMRACTEFDVEAGGQLYVKGV